MLDLTPCGCRFLPRCLNAKIYTQQPNIIVWIYENWSNKTVLNFLTSDWKFFRLYIAVMVLPKILTELKQHSAQNKKKVLIRNRLQLESHNLKAT